MKKNKTKITYTVCIVGLLVFFAVFTARLADWQLIHGGEYKTIAEKSAGFTVKSDAVRGEILDRNGVGLVVNKTRYRLVIDKLYADADTLDETILTLVGLTEKTGSGFTDLLPLELSSGGYAFTGDTAEREILLSEDFLGGEGLTAEQCAQALMKRYDIKGDYNERQRRDLMSVRYGMERRGYSSDTPFVFSDSLSDTAAGALSENTQGISGVSVQTYLEREAENPTLAPHILGALGAISEEEYAKLSDEGYSLSDSVGKFGAELAFEKQLRGVGGEKIISRDSNGAVVDTVETKDAKPGDTVWLTIDSKIQAAAAKALEENVKEARADGERQAAQGEKLVGEDCETGAAVMLSVSDFSVLAAASYPTFDLNRYGRYDDYYVSLSSDERAPLFNRALNGSFACGSVFKPCVAMAALEEKIIDENTEINCDGVYSYYPSNVVRCMHNHGDMSMHEAVVQSCNCFFAETGRRLGIEPMYLYAERFGLGEYTGIELEESSGVLAGRDSTIWQAGNTVQAAIGQSDNAFTPLQLAVYAATIANNGTRLKAGIVSKITDYERKTTLSARAPEEETVSGVSAENIGLVKQAMLDVTQSENGTAHYYFGDYGVKVAAKTGTAENSGSDHCTFICFAPYEKPEVAAAVVIEHGVKGKYAMGVAKAMLDAYFNEEEPNATIEASY